MLEALRPKYELAKKRAAEGSTARYKKGVGLSVGVYGCGLDGPDGSEARVDINHDGTITICTAWEDHGQGADIGAIGTAHEALRPLGISPDKLGLRGPIRRNAPIQACGRPRSQS